MACVSPTRFTSIPPAVGASLGIGTDELTGYTFGLGLWSS